MYLLQLHFQKNVEKMMKKLTRLFTIIFLFEIILVPVYSFEDEKIYDSVEHITEAGRYRIRIYYIDDDGLEQYDIITLTITEDDLKNTPNPIIKSVSEPQTENKKLTDSTEVIVASNIEITIGTFSRLTDQRLIDLAHVRAWIQETGETIPITEVLRKESADGITVTFKTSNQTMIQIKVFEVPAKNATWNSINRDASLASQVGAFETINPRSITITVMVLLLIPLLVIIVIYLYIQRQFKKVDELLYHASKKDRDS